MPQPRKRLVATEVTPFYRAIARCVRRHFLCGVHPLTGRDYSARKQDIKDRIALLADVFAIDVCAYAILSNHCLCGAPHKQWFDITAYAYTETAKRSASLKIRSSEDPLSDPFSSALEVLAGCVVKPAKKRPAHAPTDAMVGKGFLVADQLAAWVGHRPKLA